MEPKRIFTRKPYNSYLYKWSPDESLASNKTKTRSGLPTDCSAEPFSQGEDWITTYVYEFIITDGREHHLAYVECDYVK